jgi:hypothetical protein
VKQASKLQIEQQARKEQLQKQARRDQEPEPATIAGAEAAALKVAKKVTATAEAKKSTDGGGATSVRTSGIPADAFAAGATPSQPRAWMAVQEGVKVAACFYTKAGENEEWFEDDNCGLILDPEKSLFCMKTVAKNCCSCAPGYHRQLSAGDVKSHHLYINAFSKGEEPKIQAAFLEPSIDTSKLKCADEIIEVIINGEARLVPEWKRIFEAVNANRKWSARQVIEEMQLEPFDLLQSTKKLSALKRTPTGSNTSTSPASIEKPRCARSSPDSQYAQVRVELEMASSDEMLVSTSFAHMIHLLSPYQYYSMIPRGFLEKTT